MEGRKVSVCVFCGSGGDAHPEHIAFAEHLGQLLASLKARLIYGGGDLGAMGVLARSCLEAGGDVVGVMPAFLNRPDILGSSSATVIVTEDMHERKMRMFGMSDVIVTLPGGIGTLEEFLEIITWKQLGRHDKPVILVNVDGYWDALLQCFANMRSSGYLRDGHDFEMEVVEDIESLRKEFALLLKS